MRATASSGLASRRSGSGPSRATISSRSSAVPISHAVGPARSTVAASVDHPHPHLADRLRRLGPRWTRNLPNSPRWTWPTWPLAHQWNRCLPYASMRFSSAPSTSAASAAKRPCGEVTAIGPAPTSSLVWSRASDGSCGPRASGELRTTHDASPAGGRRPARRQTPRVDFARPLAESAVEAGDDHVRPGVVGAGSAPDLAAEHERRGPRRARRAPSRTTAALR